MLRGYEQRDGTVETSREAAAVATRPPGRAPGIERLDPKEAHVAAEQHFCERHHRPAVASRVRILPDGTRETEYLCEIGLAEERMAGGFGRRGLFDDFFSDFFGGGGGAEQTAEPRRPVERVDVTQFFSDATRELLRRAAHTALEWGSLDLESDHLLHAALHDDVVRHGCSRRTPTRRRSRRRSRTARSAGNGRTCRRRSRRTPRPL